MGDGRWEMGVPVLVRASILRGGCRLRLATKFAIKVGDKGWRLRVAIKVGDQGGD